jgi:RNA polymerase sigma-70 factor (ECF subfamily)
MSMQTAQVSSSTAIAPLEPANPRPAAESWAGVVDAMLAGDRAAQLRIARLVTGFLARWGAYDFRQEWPDLVQDVLLALVRAAREGRIEKPEALVGYVRSIAHHKFMDRLRARARHGEEPITPAEGAGALAGFDGLRTGATQDLVTDVRRALERLPERKRRVVFAVYGEGKSYEQAAQETGTPLGSVKRYLREGMEALRKDFAVELEQH